jgi:hypothetical protein
MYPKRQVALLTYFLFLALVGTLLISCTSTPKGCKEAPEVQPLTKPIKIERLDQSFWQQDTTLAATSIWLGQHNDFVDKYRKSFPGQDDSTFLAYIAGMRKDKYLDTMRRETAQMLGELKDVEAAYSDAFAYVKHYYPTAPIPAIKAFVTGFSFDVSMADSTLVMIGLESFLAGKGHYTPPMMPMYMMRRLKRTAIVPLTMMAVSNRYNKRDILDATLTADMITWGKTYYFIEKTMPCTPDSAIIGFTPDQMDFVTANEKQIYGHFIQQKLFFITNHLDKRRYVDERPLIPEISEKCPGRVARYLGWQIVRAYAKASGKSLQEIMAETNAQTIFNKAQYKPA